MMMETKNSNDRFQEALLLPERSETTQSKTEKSDPIGHVKFENYSAVYPGQKYPSLQNLNFELANGSLLGVIGLVSNS